LLDNFLSKKRLITLQKQSLQKIIKIKLQNISLVRTLHYIKI